MTSREETLLGNLIFPSPDLAGRKYWKQYVFPIFCPLSRLRIYAQILRYFRPHELLTWLFSMPDRGSKKVLNDGKISWQITYQRLLKDEDLNATEKTPTPTQVTTVDQYKIRARIEVNKDDVQKVMPLAKVIKVCQS